MDEKNRVSSISQAQSIADMAAFWDEHDATEFEDQTHEVDMTFDLAVRRHYVAIDPALLQKLQQTAMSRCCLPNLEWGQQYRSKQYCQGLVLFLNPRSHPIRSCI